MFTKSFVTAIAATGFLMTASTFSYAFTSLPSGVMTFPTGIENTKDMSIEARSGQFGTTATLQPVEAKDKKKERKQ